MTIWVYCICRNEARIMPYFMRHYSQFADYIQCFDDDSTDGTQDIIRAYPNACCCRWEGTHGIVDDEFMAFNTQVYKSQRRYVDWAIIVDADEFVYHPRIRELLQSYLDQGVEVPLIHGYGVISEVFPTTLGQIYEEARMGYRNPVYDKRVVFQTKIDMEWHHGRHLLSQGFNPKASAKAELKLLHYRHLAPEYVQDRNLNNWNRMPERNQKGGFGWTCNPKWNGEGSHQWYTEIDRSKLFDVLTHQAIT